MIKLGTLFWEMAVDSRGLHDGLNDGERQVQTFASRAEVGLNKATVAFGALGLAAVKVAGDAARAFVSFTKDSIALASAAKEAGSKFDVVFGAGARQAEADLAAMAGTVQRSKYELKEMAASVQDVFVPLGFAREEAQKLSLTLTQLAVDVGSFNNVADGEAMAAFQSASAIKIQPSRFFTDLRTSAAFFTHSSGFLLNAASLTSKSFCSIGLKTFFLLSTLNANEIVGRKFHFGELGLGHHGQKCSKKNFNSVLHKLRDPEFAIYF
jgi:hypothetical protein